MKCLVIFITKKQLYNDNIYMNNENIEIIYSGQNQGIYDYQLIKAINKNYLIKVFYRDISNTSFIFIGETNNSSIIQNRQKNKNENTNDNERLKIKIIIPKENITNKKIDINNKCHKKYKFKKAVYDYLDIKQSINPNIGYFLYNQE